MKPQMKWLWTCRPHGRKISRYALYVAAIGGMVLALLSGCAPAATPTPVPKPAEPTKAPTPPPATPTTTPAKPVELVLASSQELQETDPLQTFMVNDVNLLYVNLYDALVVRNQQGGLDPGLAESWEMVSPTEWIFHLRKGVKFHNGDPFTAKDVAFVVNRAITTKDTHAEIRGNLAGVQVIDDYTVKITTSVPDPLFLEHLWYTVMIPKDYYEKVGREEFRSHPIGTGPFKWVEWVKGSHYTLEKNPDYWRGEPKIDRVTVRLISEIATRVAALKAGEMDLILQLPPDEAPVIKATSGLRVEAENNVRQIYLEFFPESPVGSGAPLEDVRVRQALNYAVDVETIIQKVLGGYATRIATLIPKEAAGYDASIEPYPYDPAKARQLLAEAGYPNGFTIDVDVPTGGNVLKPVELNEAIAGYWDAVGVKAKLRTLEYGTYAQLKRNYQIAPIFVWNWNGFDGDQHLWGNVYSESPWFYFPGWSKEVDELIDQERTTIDKATRQQAFSKLQQILKEQAGYIFLYQQMDTYGVNERLDWVPCIGGPVFLWNVAVRP